MTIWLDTHLPPALCHWLREAHSVNATHVRELALQAASDREIFLRARAADAILMSKDSDFVDLVQTMGSPPKLIWVTCGNTTNERLRQVLEATLPVALTLLTQGQSIVEIREP